MDLVLTLAHLATCWIVSNSTSKRSSSSVWFFPAVIDSSRSRNDQHRIERARSPMNCVHRKPGSFFTAGVHALWSRRIGVGDASLPGRLVNSGVNFRWWRNHNCCTILRQELMLYSLDSDSTILQGVLNVDHLVHKFSRVQNDPRLAASLLPIIHENSSY